MKTTNKNKKQKIDPEELFCHKNICFTLMDIVDKRSIRQDTKLKKRSEEFKKQRITRGFDDSETWWLDQVIVSFVLPRLKRFKEISCAIPCNVAHSVESMTEELWNKILDQIIEAFELIKKDEWSGEIEEKFNKIDRGLHLFADYFMQLNW
jgi:hypothetical protein